MARDAAARLRAFDELYEEIAGLRPGLTGEILEPGVVRVMSRPGRGHRKAHKQIRALLQRADQDVGGVGWWIEDEVEIRLSSDRLAVPDLAGWRVERVPELPDENPIEIVPDWCCEVLSPSTARDDRRLKLPLYAASGVAHVWLVDPSVRLVEVFETRGGKPTLVATAADDETAALPPFPELPLDLSLLWLAPSGSAKP
jgi:Uma2 family endonuclease